MNEIVKIERMSYGPDAIGHLASGKTVFVRGGVPGAEVEVELTEEKPRFARGVAVGVDQAPAYAPWALLPYEMQLEHKRENVLQALIRTGNIPKEKADEILQPIVACKREWGYRNKLEMAPTYESGKFALGFCEMGSQEVVPANSCKLGNRLIEKAPKALGGALKYLQGREGDLGIHRVSVRGSVRTKSIEVALWTRPSSFPRNFAAKIIEDAIGATSVVRVIADEGSARKVKKVEVLSGEGFWRERMELKTAYGEEGLTSDFLISAPSFFQVNTAQAEKLVLLVVNAIDLKSHEMAADLYAGAGTFTIPLAESGAHVEAIELAGSSARDFRRNCDLNCVGPQMTCDDVARALPKIGQPDAVVVDPPRAGLQDKVVRQIAAANPSRIAYVSCDIQTLARDIARFAKLGYGPKSITPVDMFPQTFHTECVCNLASI